MSLKIKKTGWTEQRKQNEQTESADYTEWAEQTEKTQYNKNIEKVAILKDLQERIYRSNFDLVFSVDKT